MLVLNDLHAFTQSVLYVFQLLGDLDDLLEWFGDTERQIQDSEPISSDTDKLRAELRDHKVRRVCHLIVWWIEAVIR